MCIEQFKEQVEKVYQEIKKLEKISKTISVCNNRKFTPDGHLVGSIGECLVAVTYDLELKKTSNKGFDAVYTNNNGKERKVEIKTTQSDRVAFRIHNNPADRPDHVIIIKLNFKKNDSFKECYNGPYDIIAKNLRNPSTNGQAQISLTQIQELYKKVNDRDKIPRK